MEKEISDNAEIMRDFMDTGGGAGVLGALFFMFLGVLEGLAIGYFIWR